MTKTRTIIRLLVASPNDVSEERARLRTVVDDINETFANQMDMHIELLDWERDVVPGFGVDPQGVINEADIARDYDILLAIFWHRLGTPTPRHDSGTIEEYQLAKERHEADPTSVQIMLYFKDAPPLSLDDVDPEQLQAVRDFRRGVSNHALYATFTTPDDFANRTKLHLTKLVLNWEDRFVATPIATLQEASATPADSPRDSGTLESDYGIFELDEMVSAELTGLHGVVERMTVALADVARDVEHRGKTLSLLTITMSNANDAASQRRLKARGMSILRQIADDLNSFVDRMDRELSLYRQHLDNAVDRFTQLAPLYGDLGESTSNELKAAMNAMVSAMNETAEQLEVTQGLVRELPRLTTPLIRAKRSTESVLQETIDITKEATTSFEAALELLPDGDAETERK